MASWIPVSSRALALVAAGGLAGTLARYLVSLQATRGAFPWGTTIVNLTGSFALGLFMFTAAAKGNATADLRLFFAVGFLGAYTTMSAFAYETVVFMLAGDWRSAALGFVLNPFLCVAGALAGRATALALA